MTNKRSGAGQTGPRTFTGNRNFCSVRVTGNGAWNQAATALWAQDH